MRQRPPPEGSVPPLDPEHAPGAAQAGQLSAPIRALLIAVGTVTLIVGVIGIVVPVLPTTPFLLLTAACYARASTRLYAWLLGQPSLGPIVAEWRRSRQLPPGVKTRALVAVALTFAISIILVGDPILTVVLVVTGSILGLFLWRIPSAQTSPE